MRPLTCRGTPGHARRNGEQSGEFGLRSVPLQGGHSLPAQCRRSVGSESFPQVNHAAVRLEPQIHLRVSGVARGHHGAMVFRRTLGPEEQRPVKRRGEGALATLIGTADQGSCRVEVDRQVTVDPLVPDAGGEKAHAQGRPHSACSSRRATRAIRADSSPPAARRNNSPATREINGSAVRSASASHSAGVGASRV